LLAPLAGAGDTGATGGAATEASFANSSPVSSFAPSVLEIFSVVASATAEGSSTEDSRVAEVESSTARVKPSGEAIDVTGSRSEDEGTSTDSDAMALLLLLSLASASALCSVAAATVSDEGGSV